MLHVVVASLVAFGIKSSKSFFACSSIFGDLKFYFEGILFLLF